MTAGTDAADTMDGMSKTRIEKIIQSLTDGSFRWQPARRVYIPKANGKQRPLGLPGWTDKLVQEVMRLILEAYYEPRFSPHSHGYRPTRGCHTALHEIQGRWKGTVWFIEHKQTVTWVYRHYRRTSPEGLKCLEVKRERGEEKPLIARFGGKPIRYAKFARIENRIPQLYLARTQLVQRLLADQCELCGSTGKIEIHHIHSSKQLIQKYRKRGADMPWWVKKMAGMYRKTLAVCVACHHQIHTGTYDGRKLI
jgi:hypothetical protein